MSLPVEQSSQRSQEPVQQPEHYQRKIQEILKKIKKHVKILQERVFSYGMSSSQFLKILQNSLTRLVSKDRPLKFNTPAQFIKAISMYISKRPSRALKLLIGIINSIDEQVTQLESSAPEDECGSCRRTCQKGLKLEQKQSQQKESQNEPKIEFKHIPHSSLQGTSGNGDLPIYVKFEPVQGQPINQQHESSNTTKRKKGRPNANGRSRRKN